MERCCRGISCDPFNVTIQYAVTKEAPLTSWRILVYSVKYVIITAVQSGLTVAAYYRFGYNYIIL